MIRSNNVRVFQRKATSNVKLFSRSLFTLLWYSLTCANKKKSLENIFSFTHRIEKTFKTAGLPVGKSSSLKVVASNCDGSEGKTVQKKEKKKVKRD